MSLTARLRSYAASDDPRVAACNTIALAVAASQPTYPLYVHLLVGEGAMLSLWTFLSTPLFLAVPAAARVDARLGRALLPLAGIANTVLCAKLFGVGSGVELFLMACAAIAALAFRRSERAVALALCAIAGLAYLGLHEHYGAPVAGLSAEAYAAMLRLNATSVGALLVIVGFVFASAFEARSDRS